MGIIRPKSEEVTKLLFSPTRAVQVALLHK